MNKLFTKIAALCLGATMAVGVGVAVASGSKEATPVHAAETKVYTLDGTVTGSGNSYAGDNSATVDGLSWTIQGNATTSPWRLGGKPAANTDRAIYSNSSLGTKTTEDISKVVVTLGTKQSQITVNSISIKVGTSSNGSDISSETITQGVNSSNASVTFNRPSNKSWASRFFSIVLNVSSSKTSSNYYVQFSKAEFYYEQLTDQSISGSTSGTVGTGVTLTTSATSANWAITGGTGTATLSASSGKTTTVNATAAGTIIVTASGDGLKSATHTITFTAANVESITVTGTSSMYVEDGSVSLTATPSNFTPSSYTWVSSNTSVATISGTGTTGTVSAVAKGTTYITAKAQGSQGEVVSNSFALTVKKFSIALSTASVSMKASKSTTVTVTPTDANGTVVVTATSNNTSVATTSVSGTTITINSGSDGGVSTTITVSAKDNNGASGYHTAVNQTINVEVTAGYIVGNKITALPSSDKYVFLGTGSKNYWVGTPNGSNQFPQESSDENAALYILSSTGTLRYYNQDTDQAGNYIYCSGSNTTVSYSSSTAQWSAGMNNASYSGLLQLSGNRFLMFNASIVKAYAGTDSNLSSNASLIIYAYEAVASTPTVALSGDSVTGLKDNPADTSLTLTISNFTATGLNVSYKDNGESSFSGSSSVASVSCGYNTGANTVSVSFNGIGSTTVKLSVTRGSGDPIEKTFTVTVAAKPESMTIVHSDISEGHLEIQSGHEYKQVSFAGEDTDGNSYAITADDVTGSIQSGSSYVSLSGSRIYGETAGTAVVRYTLKALTSVYAEVTVDVRDDYKTTVNTITVINGTQVSQGDTLVVSNHISAKTANTHFGSTTDIADNELLFSYTNDRAAGVIYSSFVFDVTDSSLDAGDTETRTIYVFASFDENYAGTSFTAVIEVADRPVIGLLVDGVAVDPEDEIPLSIPRNSTYDLSEHVTVNPTNATESHQIDYAIFIGSEYASVSAAGVITTGSKTGNLACVSATSHAHSNFVVYFDITITREAMTITADMPVSFTKVTSASDLTDGEYAIVFEDGANSYAFDGASFTDAAGNYVAASITDGVLEASSALKAATVWITDTEDGYTIQSHDKAKYITGKQNNNNGCTIGTTPTYNTITFGTESDTTVALIKDSANNVFRMNPNSGNPWFRFYKSGTYTGQSPVQLYKLAGGAREVTVTDALFNVVNAAMSLKSGSTTLYDLNLCDATGATFNTGAWTTLGGQFTTEIKTANELAYARSNESGNEIEQFLAVYDYVVHKYGSTYDFLGRIASGKVSAPTKITPMSMVSDTNAVAIIVVISVISVSAIGGYFFLRKRREEN